MIICVLLISAFAANPFPLWERTPDGEPRVFVDPAMGEERLYIYGSHDSRIVADRITLCGSAPLDDLNDWRHEGEHFTSINWTEWTISIGMGSMILA